MAAADKALQIVNGKFQRVSDAGSIDVGTGISSSSGTLTLTPTSGGVRVATDGTAGTPALNFGSLIDSDTGWFHPAADTQAWSTGGTERMRLSGTGLGIGTTPSYQLHVRKDQNDSTYFVLENATSGANAFTALIFGDLTSGNQYGQLGYTSPTTALGGVYAADQVSLVSNGNVSNGIRIATEGTAPIDFWTSAAQRMVLTSGGNLDIGGTAGANKLTVTTDGSAGTPAISLGATADSDTGWFHPAADTQAWSTGGTERLRLNSTGQLGIGTSPTSLLHIHTAAGSNPTFAISDGDVAHGLTGVVPTDTIGRFTTATTSTASRGGLLIESFANAIGAADGTNIFWATEITNGGNPYFVFRSSTLSGTTRSAPSQTSGRIHTSWQNHSSSSLLMVMSTDGKLSLSGSAPVAAGSLLDVATTTVNYQAAADTSFSIAKFSGLVREANSGTTHPVLATVEVQPATISDSTSATTVATALWVAGVPTGVTPTAGSYAAFIQGVSRIAVDGSASAPALLFGATADNDTGFWHPAADTIAASTGGTERIRLTSTGLGLGSQTSPDGVLHIGTTANHIFHQATVNTTDATVTTLQTIATASDTSYLVESRIVGRRTGGGAGSADDTAAYFIRALYKNVAGTLSVNIMSTDTYEDQSAWDAALTTSSTNIIVQVTGAVSNNVTWTTTTTVNKV